MLHRIATFKVINIIKPTGVLVSILGGPKDIIYFLVKYYLRNTIESTLTSLLRH